MELGAVIESLGSEIAKEAIRLTNHRGAKTVSKIDIKAAISSQAER